MSERPLRIGTRGSALALAQSGQVAAAIGNAELITITTSGDEGSPLANVPGGGGDKSRFVREIERALLEGEIDLAVHSAKDLPIELPEGLALVGVPPREVPADAWVAGPDGPQSLDEVPLGARVGTASVRRRSQLLAIRPDLEISELRGNVDTRLRKLAEGEHDGIVLAAAGLRRLGREDEISFLLGPGVMTPAAGQGALALEAREGDRHAFAAAAGLTDPRSLMELTAERAVIRGLEADCDTPVGVSAVRRGDELGLFGYAGAPDGSAWVRELVSGDPGQPVALAESLLAELEDEGAREILAAAAASGEGA